MVLRQASPLYGCFVPVSMGAVIRSETSLIIASVAHHCRPAALKGQSYLVADLVPMTATQRNPSPLPRLQRTGQLADDLVLDGEPVDRLIHLRFRFGNMSLEAWSDISRRCI
jgi:hypothetical protein